MRSLQELRSLVALARRFGQEPAAELLEQIDVLEKDEAQRLKREAEIRARVAEDLTELFNLKETPHELVQPQTQQTSDTAGAIAESAEPELPATVAAQPIPLAQPTIAAQVARVITEQGVVAPDPVLARPQKNLELEIKYLREWIGKIAAAGPGSGEVNLRYLDDVDRNTISDGLYLRYNASTKKFMFDHGTYNMHHGAWQSNITQTSNATSATLIQVEQIDLSLGITVTSNTRIVFSHEGVFNVQFSVQLLNRGNAPDQAYIWFRQNGTDIPNSNSIVTVPSKDNNNTPGAVIASWNYFVKTLVPNEFLEMLWFVNDETHTFISAVSSQAATASTPFLPAVPSVIITANEIRSDGG